MAEQLARQVGVEISIGHSLHCRHSVRRDRSNFNALESTWRMRQIGENSVRRVGRLLLLDSGSVVVMNETCYILTGFGALRSDDVLVRYRNSDGRFVDTTLARLPVEDVLAGLPVREFRSYKERRHYSGWYWSSTTGNHLVHESRLELARLLVADRDSTVVAIAAQPFLLDGSDGGRVRRHVPDLLLARAGVG
ncbi:TnsA-like heteromeric transposase endonuclease subunit [Nocardia sp. XZ_19_369]|uniref:TnsA-like heteromeric transposase endonuclease subunit n=1 Tax=Nocardia sp. XZ_19_369 TaxID=2769487 RepID=UPI001E33B02B|nr:TnsA-like heteromeric transposase endonuclease subunit [Nocardia sp. XZ_19_369]